MVNEQIKTEIAKRVKSEFDSLKESLSLLSLPFISKYRVYTFSGQASGLLTALFDINEVVGRILVIKSIRFDYYRESGGALISDIAFTDGTKENIDENLRINRVFDNYDSSTLIQMTINGSPVGMFGNNVATMSYPADLFLDNIFYKYPEKIQTWTMLVNTIFGTAPDDNTAYVPAVKVTVECYLI